MRIIEDASLVDITEDWSLVRSPSRAARRRHKHRQNIILRGTPQTTVTVLPNGIVVAHPATAAALRRELARLPLAAVY